MFYTGNDNYMQDFYCYNQNPNTYSNINGIQNGINNSIWNQQTNPYINSNMVPNNMNPNNNFSSLYPSIYRILMPVIARILQNSNYQILNEDVLNNMVDTVYNIVEGQIDYSDDPNNILNNYTISNSSSNSSNMQNLNNNNSQNNQTSKSSDTKTQSSNTTNINNRDNSLLKDIIKILLLREILMKNQIQMLTMGTFLF